jgi:hypothetical protein
MALVVSPSRARIIMKPGVGLLEIITVHEGARTRLIRMVEFMAHAMSSKVHIQALNDCSVYGM